MSVDPPLRDELFGDGDEHVLDYNDADLVAEAMRLYGVPKPEAEKRVLNDPYGVASDVSRRWL